MPDDKMAQSPREHTVAPSFEIPASTPEQSSPTEREPVFEVAAEREQPVEHVETKEEEGFLDEAIEGLKQKLRKPSKQPQAMPQVRDELTVQIEKIMEDGLKDAYIELTPVQQQEFKIKGEEVAYKIRDLLKASHVKVKKIFKLLVEWLKLLPGVNRFFLEQEAKIKADKILSLKHFEKFK